MNEVFYWKILKKIFITVIIVVAAIFGIMFFKTSIDRIFANIEKQQASVFVLVNRGQVALSLQHDFEQVGSPESRIKNALLPVDDISEFVSSLDSLGERYSLPRAANFVPPPDEHKVDFSVTLKANRESLIKYLQSFESLPYLAKVNFLSVVSSGKNWDEVNNIIISGQLFTRAPKY